MSLFQNIELTDSIKQLCKLTRKRLRKDWDSVFAVEGIDPGIGKTCLMVTMGWAIDPENFDLDRSISYLPDYKEVERKFDQLPQFSFFGVDEAENILYKLRWYERLQQSINMMYMRERKQNKATCLCLPRFRDLNEQFRNYRVKYRIWLIDRGVGIAYIKDGDKDVDDPWHVKENVKIKEKFFRKKAIAERDVEDILRAERKTLNYWFDFTFNDLPQEVWGEYKRLHNHYRSKQKPLTDDEFNRRERLWRVGFIRLYFQIKELNPDMTDRKIEELSGISHQSISHWKRKYGKSI